MSIFQTMFKPFELQKLNLRLIFQCVKWAVSVRGIYPLVSHSDVTSVLLLKLLF